MGKNEKNMVEKQRIKEVINVKEGGRCCTKSRTVSEAVPPPHTSLALANAAASCLIGSELWPHVRLAQCSAHKGEVRDYRSQLTD